MTNLHADIISGSKWLWITDDPSCIDILRKNRTVTLFAHYDSNLDPIKTQVSLIYIEKCEIPNTVSRF